MKRQRDDAKIRGHNRSVIFDKMFKLAFPECFGSMEVDVEKEEGAIEEDDQSVKDLMESRRRQIDEMVECLDSLLSTLNEKNVSLFIRVVVRCGVQLCRSLLKETLVNMNYSDGFYD